MGNLINLAAVKTRTQQKEVPTVAIEMPSAARNIAQELPVLL